MKLFKTLLFLSLSTVLLTSFTRCKSALEVTELENNKPVLKLQDNTSFKLGETYYQSWVATVKGGGSGVHLYINLKSNKNNVSLDTAYFRGLKAKIEIGKMSYIAYFKTSVNNRDDIIMSNDKNAEFGNKMPKKQDFPFDLKDNECVISYTEDNIIKYHKIENLTEKEN